MGDLLVIVFGGETDAWAVGADPADTKLVGGFGFERAGDLDAGVGVAVDVDYWDAVCRAGGVVA